MKAQLQTAMKESMKARDKVAVDTIRSILSAIQYEEIEKKIEPLPSEAVMGIIQREMKKRREEIEFAEKASRLELKDKFLAEIAVIERFLPKQLNSNELESLIGEIKLNSPDINMGMAMKALKEKYAGQYDAKAASEIAKRVFG